MVISQSLRVVSGITADYSMLTFEVILVISQSSRGVGDTTAECFMLTFKGIMVISQSPRVVGDKRDECSMLKTARIAHNLNIKKHPYASLRLSLQIL